jgi:UDP-glucose:(heptosyl)LPS alpha-1,3-glucosyltransferase
MSRHAGPISRFWARVNPREFANLHLERRSFKELPRQKIVCVSEGVKQEVVNNYGILPERIRVIYNGVDIDRFNPAIRHPSLRDRLGFKQGQILVLFAGSGFKRKGLKFAICAVSRVSNKDARLLVAGRGDPLPYLRLAERLGIAGRIHFLGQQHQIQEIYAISDILLHPTIYDPFPNVCLEAMAMGLPVITTRIAGVSELITHERDGFVVQDAGRLDELVPLLNRLCHDPALRGEIGGQARATAARYTVKRNVESNLALYHEVIKDKSMMY